MKKKEKAAADVQTAQQTTSAPETKEKKGVLIILVDILLVLVIILAAFCTYISFVNTSGSGVPSLFGVHLLSVQTESMYPTIKPGDLIYDRRVKDARTLRTGDIITYWTIINGERVLNTHRITEIYDGGGYLIFATKGDNNTLEDPLTVHESEVVGLYAGRIQGLGKVFDYLQTSTGFLIVVVIPVALFFIYHLVQFFRTLFEYQKVKNMLQYELEREKLTGSEAEQESEEETRRREREKLEAELREKLREELLAAGLAAAGGKPKPETGPETEAEPEPESEAKAEAEAETETDAETETEAEPETETEPESEAEPGPAAQPDPEAEREALKAQLRAELEAELRAQLEAELKGGAAGGSGEAPRA